jgi:hypothetical protein
MHLPLREEYCRHPLIALPSVRKAAATLNHNVARSRMPCSVVKSPTKLRIDLARVVVVKSSEGQAVVQ